MKYNSTTITLTTNAVVQMDYFGSKSKYSEEATSLKARALAILLGEYNQYGRDIDLEEYRKVLAKFEDAIFEMRALLSNADYKKQQELDYANSKLEA